MKLFIVCLVAGLLMPIHVEMPIIHVTTPDGPATLSGPGAEWLLETGFPIVEFPIVE